jgi:ubiquinone/menaquinone biosynthesis C-methylase UbiE
MNDGLATRRLRDEQVLAFDLDYVNADMWADVRALFAARFPEGQFTLLDVGGGNGHFVDIVLATYPEASATLIDNAGLLLAANRSHPRKELVSGSVENLGLRFNGRTFDVICLHWTLHHLVLDSYRDTTAFQQRVIRDAASLLSPRGRLSVFENVFNGLVIDSLPGRIAYRLTSSRSLAPLMRKVGANTAGVGVCFLSEQQWLTIFKLIGLEVMQRRYYPHRVRLGHKVALSARSVRKVHYWIACQESKRTAGTLHETDQEDHG